MEVSPNLSFPLAYPVDRCVPGSLVTNDYYMYKCSTNNSFLFKWHYSSSDCSSNGSIVDTWNNGSFAFPGLLYSFMCDGTYSNDTYFTLDFATCSSISKTVYVVPDVCYFDSEMNSTITTAYEWSCGQTTASISFNLFNVTLTGQRSCSSSNLNAPMISNSTCSPIFGNNSAVISSNKCPSGSHTGGGGGGTTSSSSGTIMLTVGIMWLIASFIAIIFV